jgi:hypothetical protein
MKHYKELLLKKLSASGWELIEQDDNTDWWLDEAWRVKSTAQHWGEEIYILFLVDPQYDGTKKDTAVWAVMAVKKVPNQRPTGDQGIVEMDLQKGKLDQKLEAFIQGINAYRNDIGLDS